MQLSSVLRHSFLYLFYIFRFAVKRWWMQLVYLCAWWVTSVYLASTFPSDIAANYFRFSVGWLYNCNNILETKACLNKQTGMLLDSQSSVQVCDATVDA